MTTLTVRRPFTILLLFAVTAAILVTTISLSGKSYSKVDPVPFEDVRHLAERLAHRATSTQILAVMVMPIVANVLLFVPWGFLMFITLYTLERPTVQTYVLTILLGLSFTLAIEGWQYFLPSRVADINDVIWNTVGTVLGAILGHARQRVRFEFE
ncbi:MAG TPA: VanZ family protein [Thermoanaerobaculia bacterium]|nr:VanZ family protein [Thermoanaerobaculia bacterium]